jgi:HD-GYP domain-containing protein (c-di-GMP phosphodiesterase class II)
MRQVQAEKPRQPVLHTDSSGSGKNIRLLDLIVAVSEAMDLMSPVLVNHHKQVAYIAYRIAGTMELSLKERADIVWAGLLHDSGALSLALRHHSLEFDLQDPADHEEMGYQLVKGFEPFARAASLIRNHHVRWNDGRGADNHATGIDIGSHVLHLADRVAVLTAGRTPILEHVRSITSTVENQRGKMFSPDLVDILRDLGTQPSFWLDVTSDRLDDILRQLTGEIIHSVNWDDLLQLGKFFSRLIDFRSPWTATHTSGVSVAAQVIGKLMGLPESRCTMLAVAGHLHDLGKLAIPLEILEKPGRLTDADFAVMKRHPLCTYSVLSNVPELEEINKWASFHHERLDGTGYPFSMSSEDLSIEARIVAIADTFTALSEDRPYRPGLPSTTRRQILRDMGRNGFLDSDIISVLARHFSEVDEILYIVQNKTALEYMSWTPVATSQRVTSV